MKKEQIIGGKKYRKVAPQVDRSKAYVLTEAVQLVQKMSQDAGRKFDETLNISMNLGVDPKHSDQNVRGMVQLPAGTGKSVRVIVFCKPEKAEAALKAGADAAGGDDL
ncbi:MAG: 50S ribosomal protein L1, partial [Alphaproteobacteria bacterium]|nr:50S ribosomal protein L1 [Alphaproteobacteria bacterium]